MTSSRPPWWAGPGPIAAGFGMVVAIIGKTRVDDEAYWLDEAVTAELVRRPFSHLWRAVWALEANMAPYYLALWFWARLVPGDSGLRLFSVLGGVATVVLVVLVGSRWTGRATAALAAALLAINPFFLRYLTEARGYAWIMALSVLFAWLVGETVDRPTIGRGVALGLVTGVTTATLYLFALWVVAVALGLVAIGVLGRRHVPAMLAASVTGFLVLLPFLHVLTQTRGQVDWIPSTTLRLVAQNAYQLLGGRWGAAVMGVGLLAWFACRAGPTSGPPGVAPKDRVAQSVVVAMVVGGPALVVFVSLLKPFLVTRYLAPSAPFVAVLASQGYVALGRRLGERAILIPSLVALVVAVGCFLVQDPMADKPRAEDPRAAVAHVVARLRPGDVVTMEPPAHVSILHYLGKRPDIDPGWAPSTSVHPNHPRVPMGQLVPVLGRARRVFVFMYDRDRPHPLTERLVADRTVTKTGFGYLEVWLIE